MADGERLTDGLTLALAPALNVGDGVEDCEEERETVDDPESLPVGEEDGVGAAVPVPVPVGDAVPVLLGVRDGVGVAVTEGVIEFDAENDEEGVILAVPP